MLMLALDADIIELPLVSRSPPRLGAVSSEILFTPLRPEIAIPPTVEPSPLKSLKVDSSSAISPSANTKFDLVSFTRLKNNLRKAIDTPKHIYNVK